MTDNIMFDVSNICDQISNLELKEKVDAINQIREQLHKVSPFKTEPVDFVKWVVNDDVQANDYNPNSVAPPEMELLRTSIRADGYTQPIVGNMEGEKIVVVDGFHRHRVGKECLDINSRIYGFLPVVQIRAEQVGKTERMASTVRHNRARGKHKVEAMSDMVIELKRRNWSNKKICQELGMDEDEVLRLCQITGLSDIFADGEFSKAWEPQGYITPEDFDDISGSKDDYENEEVTVKTANTDDENRIFHTFDKWECAKAGFYETKPPKGMTADNCRAYYRDLLSDTEEFARVLDDVIPKWKNSCEHYLTNTAMNRIAWLGQAALCHKYGIPAEFRGGYSLLTEEQQKSADNVALKALNKWLEENGRELVPMEEASPDRQADIY
jgi:ParB-like chromosome segregation protein Spo0J